MNEISNIHAFEDEEFLHACFVWGMAVLVVIYACAEGVVYSRRRYVAVCLAPTVVVTAAFALGFAFSGYPLMCYLAAGLHLSGCVGDWYYVRTILRDRRIVACEDTSFGVRFFAR